MPLVSVIVPALVVDFELQRCLDSLRAALPEPGTCEVVLVMPAQHVDAARRAHPDVRVVAESRPSVYAAMNDGVAASSGRYLYFLGKDDIVLPTLREVLPVLRSQSPSVVFASVYWGASGLRRTRTSRIAILDHNVCHQGIVYARETVLRHGPYQRRFKVRADHLLNIRILWDRSSRAQARTLDVPIAWYAATGLSSRLPDRAFYRVQPAIIRRYLGPWAAWIWLAYKWIRPEEGMR